MSIPVPSDPDTVRRIVDAWVAEQADALDAHARGTLDALHPRWRQQAAQLIAEGLLAYVVIEMVAPDLAIARSGGDAGHSGHAGHAAAPAQDSELLARLGAHMRDFVDYRAELAERIDDGEIRFKPSATSGH